MLKQFIIYWPTWNLLDLKVSIPDQQRSPRSSIYIGIDRKQRTDIKILIKTLLAKLVRKFSQHCLNSGQHDWENFRSLGPICIGNNFYYLGKSTIFQWYKNMGSITWFDPINIFGQRLPKSPKSSEPCPKYCKEKIVFFSYLEVKLR